MNQIEKTVKYICPKCSHERFIKMEVEFSFNTYEITNDSDYTNGVKKKK